MSKHTLEQLFSSRIRIKVLRFLFRNPDLYFDIPGLAKRVQENTPVVAKEIEELRELGLVKLKK